MENTPVSLYASFGHFPGAKNRGSSLACHARGRGFESRRPRFGQLAIYFKFVGDLAG